MLAKRILGVIASTALLTLASSASAAGAFPKDGAFVVGAERLFGFTWTHSTVDLNPGTSTTNETAISLLVSPSTSAAGVGYAYPRIGFDYFVTENVSLGGAIGYVHSSSSTKNELNGRSVSGDGPSNNGFLFAPRVGYGLSLDDDQFAFWPRGGITYVHASSKDPDGNGETSANRLALTLEGLFAYTPIPDFGLWAGPIFDIGVSGSNKVTVTAAGTTTTTSVDAKTTDIGITTGMFVTF